MNLLSQLCMYSCTITYTFWLHNLWWWLSPLKVYENPCRKETISTSQELASPEIVVDKMYFTGHKDPWHLWNCNLRKILELWKVNYWLYVPVDIQTLITAIISVCSVTQKYVSIRSLGCFIIAQWPEVWTGVIYCSLYYCIHASIQTCKPIPG